MVDLLEALLNELREQALCHNCRSCSRNSQLCAGLGNRFISNRPQFGGVRRLGRCPFQMHAYSRGKVNSYGMGTTIAPILESIAFYDTVTPGVDLARAK